MELKLLTLQDFKHLNISMPERPCLHIWLLPADDMDNLHKESHAKVRKILAHYVNIPEEQLSFKTQIHGKPYLSYIPGNKKLYFNFSHSLEYLALAVSTSSPVGIDIENIHRKTDIDKLSKRFFHPLEVQYLDRLKNTEKKEAFFRLWTIKESFLKGLGDGLTTSPSSFCTHLSKKDLFTVIAAKDSLRHNYARWRLRPVPAPGGYMCTVAYRSYNP